MENYRHIEKIIILAFIFALSSFICEAGEATKAKPTTKSAIIISNKIDVKKITAGKPLTSGKYSTGASAPIIVDKDATAIKDGKKKDIFSGGAVSTKGLRGTVIMTSPKKSTTSTSKDKK